MVNREKVIIMTKLELYDKKYGKIDGKANEFFRHDYIYRKNFATRLFVLMGCFIMMVFYLAHKVVVEGNDLFLLDYRQEGMKAAFFTIFVLAIYTGVNTVIASAQYSTSQKRIKHQLALIKKLESIGVEMPEVDHDSSRLKEDTSLYYGADIRDKRDID